MAQFQSGGFPYVGVRLYRGETAEPFPSLWVEIDEIYEFSSLTSEWDVIDDTSHDNLTLSRATKPGLASQSLLVFKGIWRRDENAFFYNLWWARTSWSWRIIYDFVTPSPLALSFRGWISNFELAGELGDRFVYSVTFQCDGVPHQIYLSRGFCQVGVSLTATARITYFAKGSCQVGVSLTATATLTF